MADILFVHPHFPGQFLWLARHLVRDDRHTVKALTAHPPGPEEDRVDGVETIQYGTEVVADRPRQHVLYHTETFIRNAASLALKAEQLRHSGFDPQIIYTHSGWGAGAFLHNVFPRARRIKYCEWYYNKPATGIRFLKKDQPVERIIADDLLNLPILAEISHADRLIAPTAWQREQFPAAFRSRIDIIPDGLDPELFRDVDEPRFSLEDGRLLSRKDHVITYVARGADMFRGFETFVQALMRLQSKNTDFQCLIAGDTRSHYGPGHGTDEHFNAVMQNADLDRSRVHFLGRVGRPRFIDMLRVSNAHVYLTVPFVLSWSMLEAMAAGCAIIASDTPPVAEFIDDGINGRLADFFDPGQVGDSIAQLLNGGEAAAAMRQRARQAASQHWSLDKAMARHMALLNGLLQG